MQAALKLAGWIDRFTDLVGRATAWVVLGLALVMGANVLLRYGFSLGWIWTQELEWHLMVPICMLGAAYALLHKEHVRVDVLFQRYSPRTKLRVEVAGAVIGMLLSVIVVWLSLHYVVQSWTITEGSANPGGLDHRYIVKSLIPIGFSLFFLQSLSETIKGVTLLRS